MKKLLIMFIVLGNYSLSAQTIRFSDLNGKKHKGIFESYISKNGEIYSIGDTIRIGRPSGVNGEFIYMSTFGIMSALYSSATLGSSGTDIKTIIHKIRVVGSRGTGSQVVLTTKPKKGSGGINIYLENAIFSGEIKGKGMTSDEAMSKLKKAKDKLDLGLINQAEYDSTKVELVKYIK